MSDARLQAREYYLEAHRCFDCDLKRYTDSRGVFIWSPKLVLMAYPLHVSMMIPFSSNELSNLGVDGCFWYIHLCCGDLKLAFKEMNHANPLPWVVFQRGMRSSELHAIAWDKLIKYTK